MDQVTYYGIRPASSWVELDKADRAWIFQWLVSVHINNPSYQIAGQGFLFFLNKFKAAGRRENILLRLRCLSDKCALVDSRGFVFNVAPIRLGLFFSRVDYKTKGLRNANFPAPSIHLEGFPEAAAAE